jgi:hypothetical protein
VTSTTVRSSARTIEVVMRPAMKTQAGSGVFRIRFSRPRSRAPVSEIERLTKVAETSASVTMAGT